MSVSRFRDVPPVYRSVLQALVGFFCRACTTRATNFAYRTANNVLFIEVCPLECTFCLFELVKGAVHELPAHIVLQELVWVNECHSGKLHLQFATRDVNTPAVLDQARLEQCVRCQPSGFVACHQAFEDCLFLYNAVEFTVRRTLTKADQRSTTTLTVDRRDRMTAAPIVLTKEMIDKLTYTASLTHMVDCSLLVNPIARSITVVLDHFFHGPCRQE